MAEKEENKEKTKVKRRIFGQCRAVLKNRERCTEVIEQLVHAVCPNAANHRRG